jgi:hypothetical protein
MWCKNMNISEDIAIKNKVSEILSLMTIHTTHDEYLKIEIVLNETLLKIKDIYKKSK